MVFAQHRKERATIFFKTDQYPAIGAGLSLALQEQLLQLAGLLDRLAAEARRVCVRTRSALSPRRE
jgi:hypothetical protein